MPRINPRRPPTPAAGSDSGRVPRLHVDAAIATHAPLPAPLTTAAASRASTTGLPASRSWHASPHWRSRRRTPTLQRRVRPARADQEPPLGCLSTIRQAARLAGSCRWAWWKSACHGQDWVVLALATRTGSCPRSGGFSTYRLARFVSTTSVDNICNVPLASVSRELLGVRHRTGRTCSTSRSARCDAGATMRRMTRSATLERRCALRVEGRHALLEVFG